MDLWDAIGLDTPKMLACIGAGGKTSVLLTLARQARERHKPVLVSTTTKMYFSQVAELNPVFSSDFSLGAVQAVALLQKTGIAAWFSGRREDKVLGLLPEWLDRIVQLADGAFVLVEADGARGKWLKAPGDYEPVVPSCSAITVGVLNLQAIGRPFTEQIVHRLELVLEIVQKTPQELITWQDLALLATNKQGVFCKSKGRTVLLLSGAEYETQGAVRNIVEYLKSEKYINQCIIAQGYGTNLTPIEVHSI